MEYALREASGRVHTLRVSEEANYETDCGESFDPLDNDVDVDLVVNHEQVSGTQCPSCSWDVDVPTEGEATEE